MRLFGSLLGALLIWAGLLCFVLEILGAFGYFSATLMWGIEFKEFYQYMLLLLGMIIFTVVGGFLFYLKFLQGLKPTDDFSFSRLFLFFSSGLTLLFSLIFLSLLMVDFVGGTPWTLNGRTITGPDYRILYLLIFLGLSFLTVVAVYLGFFGSTKARESAMPMVPPETLNTITKMAAWAEMNTEDLDRYVQAKYNKKLYYLGIEEVEDLIRDLREKAKHKKRKS